MARMDIDYESDVEFELQESIPCVYCGGPNLPIRVAEMGYAHCTRDECVGAWRRGRIETKGLRLVLGHKQGLMWVRDEEVKTMDVTRGRS